MGVIRWSGVFWVAFFLCGLSGCGTDSSGEALSPEQLDAPDGSGDVTLPDGEAAGETSDGAVSDDMGPENSDSSEFISIIESLGLTQYAGAITPVEFSSEGNVTTYGFDSEEGPICMRGDDFLTGVRDTGSKNLVIFLQGGGACWSVFCLAVTGVTEGVPGVDILNPELEANPTRDWNAVYVPYCDGSFFVGDAEHDDDINGKGTRIHRGLANLTGSYEVASMRFPAPEKVLLAGSSGGAYGLLMAGALLRTYYPDTELIIMADSGIGIAREGDEEYIRKPLEEFNALRFIPEDCEGCLVTGHLTSLVGWFLKHDPQVRIGLFSSWYDSILADLFLQIPPEEFADSLQSQTDLIHAEYPERFRRFIKDGTQHTALIADATGVIGTDIGKLEYPEDALGGLLNGGLIIGSLSDTEIEGVTMSQWLSDLLDNNLNGWVDLLEERGPPPESSAEEGDETQ